MHRDIVVMGASSGGLAAFQQVLSALPKDLPAAIFLTLHTGPASPGLLPTILARVSQLPIIGNGFYVNRIEHGHVYVAQPNLHLIVKRGHVEHRFLPKENLVRPSIDVMFRSAARSFGRRVIGVVMTGNLDDGTAGLGIIKDEGGVAIVQDPRTAEFPDMPFAALQSGIIDYSVPLSEIAPLITSLVNSELKEDSVISERQRSESSQVLSCPGCGGILRRHVGEKVSWFQCQVGHRYSAESMITEQDRTLEEKLWTSLALLKQKEEVARNMAAEARSGGAPGFDPEIFVQQAEIAADAQQTINQLLSEKGHILFPSTFKKDMPDKS